MLNDIDARRNVLRNFAGAICKLDFKLEASCIFLRNTPDSKSERKEPMADLRISGKLFKSRLFMGTGKFHSPEVMRAAIEASETELVTLALKRVDPADAQESIVASLKHERISLLPNTSGARTAKEAVTAAELLRDVLETNWIKLEIHPDPKYLLPDAIETLQATEELTKRGFVVMPYVHADPVLCKRLEEVGTAAVMPLGSPIGTNRGIKTHDFLEIIIEQAKVPVIVDAGLGAPSHAGLALEMGADAVLVNTAIAVADDPVAMATAFKLAVCAGRMAYDAKLGGQSAHAVATSPLTSFLDG